MLGFGWEHGQILAPPAAPRRPATEALLARMAVQPNAARATLIDQLVGTLIDAWLWAKLDLL